LAYVGPFGAGPILKSGGTSPIGSIGQKRSLAMAILTKLFLKMNEERGASLVEYALLVALIALVCIAAVTSLGGTVNSKFASVSQGF
jgi:pilus assembly protein Flp/PilA